MSRIPGKDYIETYVYLSQSGELRTSIHLLVSKKEFDVPAIDFLQEICGLTHNRNTTICNPSESQCIKTLVDAIGVQTFADEIDVAHEQDFFIITKLYFQACFAHEIPCTKQTFQEYMDLYCLRSFYHPSGVHEVNLSECAECMAQRDAEDGLNASVVAQIFFDYHDNLKKGMYRPLYYSETFSQLLTSITLGILSLVDQINVCKNCGGLFVPTKSDEKYCSRITDDLTCKEHAAKKKRQKRMQTSPILKKYNSVNTNLARRAESCESPEGRKKLYKILYAFRDESIEKKRLHKNGEISEDDLLKWFDSWLINPIGGEHNGNN